MDFNFREVKNDELVRAEIDGNAIRMNKNANRRLLSAPRSMVARVKQHSDNSIILSYDAKRPLFPPVEGSTLSEVTLTAEDMAYVKKLEPAIKLKGSKGTAVNPNSVSKTIEAVSVKETIQQNTPMPADRVEVAPPKSPGFLGRISAWLGKLSG